MGDTILAKGRWLAQVHDVDGTLLWEEDFTNAVTTAGLNDILSVYFAAGTQKTAWYVGLIDNAGFTAVASTDTMASHTGWSESSAYSESLRQTWTPTAAAGGSITGAAVTFTANTTVSFKGAFLASDSAKAGTTGTLWATGTFSVQSLTNGQTLTLTYTCPLTAT